MNDTNAFALRKIDAAGAVACLALSIAAYSFGVAPALRTRAHLQTLRIAAAAESDRAGALVARVALVKSEHAKVQRELNDLALPPAGPEQLNARIEQLTRLNDEFHVKLDQILPNLTAATPGPQYTAIPIHMSGTGSYPAVVALVHKLFDTFKDMSISGVRLTSNTSETAESSGSKASYTLECTWYAVSAASAAAPDPH